MSQQTRWKLLLEYDGTDFCGWGRQPNDRTIQGVVETALSELVQEDVTLSVSGRTDAGVHALGQVASFVTRADRTPRALCAGLNGKLPPDVACLAAEPVSLDFDPRRWTKTKQYRYAWLDRQVRSPLRRTRVWHVRHHLDVDAMRQGALLLQGTHDFSSFRASGCGSRHAVRTVPVLRVRRTEDEVHLYVGGHGFLRHMIRIIAGTLLQVGQGRRPPEWVGDVLRAQQRSAAGQTAPACGLTLMWISYGEDVER